MCIFFFSFFLQNVMAAFVFSDSQCKNACNCLHICARVFHQSPTKLCPDLISFACRIVPELWSFARQIAPRFFSTPRFFPTQLRNAELRMIASVWLAANGIIKNERVAAAMKSVNRAQFSRHNPYMDAPQGIGYAVTISAPHMVSAGRRQQTCQVRTGQTR